MALATATITFDVADLLGIDFDTRRIKAWTTTNADNNRLIDTAANKVRMGDGVATVAADGTGSFSVWVPGADGNPTSWQQTFWFDYPLPGGRGRETRSFGPFTITGSADLADLEAEQAIPPTYLSQVAGALSDYVDDAQDARAGAESARTGAEAARDEAIDISGISTSDDVVEALVKPGAAGPKTKAALSASIAVVSAGRSNGTDDTSRINDLLNGGRVVVRGVPGETYKISGPLVVTSDTTLDLTDCTVRMNSGSDANMLNNLGMTAARSINDAAITAGTKILTSASASFVPGDVGTEVVVWDAGLTNAPLFTTIASRQSTTQVTLAANALQTVTDMAVSIGPRDKRVAILGGTWDHNGNVGAGYLSTDAHMLRLHRLDHLTMRNMKVTGVTYGYGVTPGDVTDFTIDNVNIDCQKGQVQPSGPAFNGHINNIHGKQYDDFVALTCSDYPGITETEGPMSHINISNVFCTSNDDTGFATTAVKLLAGYRYWMRHVTVDGIFGTSQGAPLKIGDDGTYFTTEGSKMQGIRVRNMACQPQGVPGSTTPSMVEIGLSAGAHITDLEIDGLACDFTTGVESTASAIFVSAATGTALERLVLNNVTLRGGNKVRLASIGGGGLIDELQMTDCRMLGPARDGNLLYAGSSLVINSANVTRFSAALNAGFNLIEADGRIDKLTIADGHLEGGATLFTTTTQGRPRMKLTVSNVETNSAHLANLTSAFDLDFRAVTYTGSGAMIQANYAGTDGSSIRGTVRNVLDRDRFEGTASTISWYEPAVTVYGPGASAPAAALAPTMWVRPESLDLIPDNTALATWPDSSGYGRAFTQSTSAQRPTYRTNQQNGHGAVVFDGTNDWMTTDRFPVGAGITVFLVARLDAAGSYGDLLSYEATSIEVRHNDSNRRPEVANSGGSATSAAALTLATWHQWTATIDATGSALFIDGSSVATGPAGFVHAASATLALGSRSSGVSMFGGALGEVIVVPKVVTTAERTPVEAYLKTKWSTP